MADKRGSYYKFVTEPSASLKCLICLEVAEDPRQHVACGKLFCRECIKKNGNKPCPNCRKKNPQYFQDTKSDREIKDLCVKCENVEKGCGWEGTIRTSKDHVTACAFALVPCSNQCKVEGQVLKLMRKELEHHLKTECPNQQCRCQHCGKKGTFASIKEQHDGVCMKKPVPCPNTGCTLVMERELVCRHIKYVCGYTKVACRYESIGCGTRKFRKDIRQHEEDDNKNHFHLSLRKMMEIQSANTSLKAEVTSIKNAISSIGRKVSSTEMDLLSIKESYSSTQATTENNLSSMESRMTATEEKSSSTDISISSLMAAKTSLEGKQVSSSVMRNRDITFKVPGYEKMKRDDSQFYSKPFYTSSQGYKISIHVDANGCGEGEGTHVSIFCKLCDGQYDDELAWPFMGTVTFELLNQLENKNHHSMTLKYEGRHDVRVGSSLGYRIFIPHSKLSHDPARNTQYLMNDTLYFRISVKEAKPWLVCEGPLD